MRSGRQNEQKALFRLHARQANPVIHQAYAGFAVAEDQAVQAFSVDRTLVLNFYTVSLVETVLDVGENAVENSNSFTLHEKFHLSSTVPPMPGPAPP